MKRVIAALDRHVADFERAPLFAWLADDTIPAAERLAFAPAVAHFVMSFADLYGLVLREVPARDKLQELVNAHTAEDGDHWRWYLADLARMVHDPRLPYTDALRFAFGTDTERTRRLTYGMCRLGVGADSLRKLVLVHCIEATGKVTVKHVSRVGRQLAAELGKKLVYFGPHHFDTESGHTLEDAAVHRGVEDIALTDEQATELEAMVDTSFALFRGFVDEMLDLARAARPVA